MSDKLTIALLGYGKMGKLIEETAIKRGHSIGFVATSKNAPFTIHDIKKCDVAIEFSLPNSAPQNIKTCIDANIPVAIGTTGWYDQLSEIVHYNTQHNGCILPTTNFSIGVNLFFNINEKLAKIMNPHQSYDVKIVETHHTQKLDAPSGTAITTAEGIIKHTNHIFKWVNTITTNKEDIYIESIREKDVPGTHEVIYENEIDKITLTHEAKNRLGFAMGAVIAAEFIYNKKGLFSMKDVLQFN